MAPPPLPRTLELERVLAPERTYLVRDRRSSGLVVLKRAAAPRSKLLSRLRALPRAAASHVVAERELLELGGRLFSQRPWVEGRPLRELRASEPARGLARTVELLEAVALGLTALHRRGVAHGRLHGGNVVVDAAGRPWLVDCLEAGPVLPAEDGVELCAAPEQLRGGAPTARSDVYALGLLTCELFTGRHPLAGDSWLELTRRALYEDVFFTLEEEQSLPAGLMELLQQALAKQPFRRLSSVARLAAGLRALVPAGEGAEPRVPMAEQGGASREDVAEPAGQGAAWSAPVAEPMGFVEALRGAATVPAQAAASRGPVAAPPVSAVRHPLTPAPLHEVWGAAPSAAARTMQLFAEVPVPSPAPPPQVVPQAEGVVLEAPPLAAVPRQEPVVPLHTTVPPEPAAEAVRPLGDARARMRGTLTRASTTAEFLAVGALERWWRTRPLLKLGVPVVLGAIAFAGVGGWRLFQGHALERQVEELLARKDSARARELLVAEQRRAEDDVTVEKLLGDVACASGEEDECLRQYQKVLARSSRFASDARLRQNTLALMARADRRWLVAQVAAKLDDVEEDLLAQVRDEHYWKRWNAVRALEARGDGDRVPYGVVYGLDVLHAGSCETRRAALSKLAQLKDVDALPYLEKARERASGQFFGDGCLGGALERTIRALSSPP